MGITDGFVSKMVVVVMDGAGLLLLLEAATAFSFPLKPDCCSDGKFNAMACATLRLAGGGLAASELLLLLSEGDDIGEVEELTVEGDCVLRICDVEAMRGGTLGLACDCCDCCCVDGGIRPDDPIGDFLSGMRGGWEPESVDARGRVTTGAKLETCNVGEVAGVVVALAGDDEVCCCCVVAICVGDACSGCCDCCAS